MKKIYAILLLGILAVFISSCNSPNSTSNNAEKSLYESILDEGKIKVGYVSYPPSYIVNSDGSHSGIFYEVFEKMAESLGLEVEYTKEVTWDSMIQDIKDKKIDVVVTGIWPTSQRGKYADFLNPLFYSVVKAYTYEGNNKFDHNIQAINSSDVRISTIDGEMTSIIAKLDFPLASRVDVTQLTGVSQTLLDVHNKKADITFVEPSIALEYLEKNPESIKEVLGIKPLRVFPNSMMLPKGEEKLKSMLNIAINELINNGYVDKVIDKYEKYDYSYRRVALPYQKID